MKIYTFVAIKGGVGKTSITYNFGEWLARNGKKVLLIDADHQCNLTQLYNIYTNEGTLTDIFTDNGNNVKILNIKENLDIIPASLLLDEASENLVTKSNKELIFFMWLNDNYDKVISDYDYILIDCRPDFSTITKNMVAVSDFIISPVQAGEFSDTAKMNLESRFDKLQRELVDPVSREPYSTAKLLFIGSKIKHNTKLSIDFKKNFFKKENTLNLIFPEKELVNTGIDRKTPLVEFSSDKSIYNKHKEFFDNMEIFFTTLANLEE